MAIYKTAQGKTIDMASMMLQNEKTRAVGNGKMNARGDTIDAQGRVVVPVTQKVSQAYAKTVNNPGAQITESAPAPQISTSNEIPTVELTDFEKELNQEMETDAEIEAIKRAETSKRKSK